jgi:hypothetical protein
MIEIKNLFDANVKQEIINRINKLTIQSQRQWGKMDVAQMLAHVQQPIEVAFGKRQLKAHWLLKTIGPLFKSKLYNGQPYKQGLPTDRSYIMTGTVKDFEKEKQQLLDLINQFEESKIVDANHPVFGKFTKEQWSLATWKHIDHHLRQFGV